MPSAAEKEHRIRQQKEDRANREFMTGRQFEIARNVRGWLQMDGDGRKWPQIDRDGRKRPRMAKDGLKRLPEIAVGLAWMEWDLCRTLRERSKARSACAPRFFINGMS